MKFADIPGHDDIKERLRKLVDADRIPHALLLEGPTGTGKFALARALAQYIHCENRLPSGDSCGTCPSCVQHQSFNHIDTIFSFPIVKKGTGTSAISDEFMEEFKELMLDNQFMDFEDWLIKLDNINAQPQIYVEEANELLRKLNFTTHNSKFKIVLMWLPERLKEEAANKLLKLVEEPFPDTLFVMASNQSKLILPTIYSRTQRISVKRYSDDEISYYLRENYGLDYENSALIAKLAAGNIVEATKLINVSKERTIFLKFFMELMRKAYIRSVGDLKQWAADVAALGREREMQFLDYCARMIRENFILNLKVPDLNCLSQEEKEFSSRFSPFINERNVIKLFQCLNDARTDIASNANAKLVNFDLAIKVILLLKS